MSKFTPTYDTEDALNLILNWTKKNPGRDPTFFERNLLLQEMDSLISLGPNSYRKGFDDGWEERNLDAEKEIEEAEDEKGEEMIQDFDRVAYHLLVRIFENEEKGFFNQEMEEWFITHKKEIRNILNSFVDAILERI